MTGEDGYVLGADCSIDDDVTLGYGFEEYGEPTRIGDGASVRAGSVVYADVQIGDRFATGHNVLVREETDLGDDVLVGTASVIDGSVEVGSRVSLQTGVYLPPETRIGDDVFVGPHAVLTNDPYPVRQDVPLAGPIVRDQASIGANATILPGVDVGERAFVAAGAVVTKDVPADTLAYGVPAERKPVPENLRDENSIR
jgi:acetyltransferase-like isoleucine patch superfamily enzyme